MNNRRRRRRTLSYNEAEHSDNSAANRFEKVQRMALENLAKSMNQYRKMGLHCDFTIKIDGTEFPVHKVIVSSASPFFAALFENKEIKYLENSQNFVELKDISVENAERIITYMYSGEIDLNYSNLQDIAIGSRMYQLSNLFELCMEYMVSNMTSSNAIGFLCFAEFYAADTYKREFQRFCEQNFSEICTEGEFNILTDALLKSFLRSESLSIVSEMEVLRATMNWFHHDPTSRMVFFDEFLSYVRMPLVTLSQINEIRQVFKDSPVLERFEQVIRPSAIQELSKSNYAEIRFHSRYCTRKRIFVVGGNPNYNMMPYMFNTTAMYIIELSRHKNKITLGPSCLLATIDSEAAIVGDHLYVLGGSFNGAPTNAVQRYNIKENNATWEQVTPMISPREGLFVAVHNKKLFAIGGRYLNRQQHTIEMYNPEDGTWQVYDNFTPQLCPLGVAQIGSKLYFISPSTMTTFSTFHEYDIETKTLTQLPPLPANKALFAVAVMQDHIYVMGGVDLQGNKSKSVEVFNIRKNRWHIAAPMRTECSLVKAVVVNNIIYVFSFQKNNRFTPETYDPSTNCWFHSTNIVFDYCRSAVAVENS